MAFADLRGELEPCGCSERTRGGLEQLAALVKHQRASQTPTLVVGLGELFARSEREAADGPTRAQHELSHSALLGIFTNIGLDVAGPRAASSERSSSSLRWLARTSRTTVVWPDAQRDASSAEQPALRQVGPYRVGVVHGESARAAADVARLRAKGADWVLALQTRATSRPQAQADIALVAPDGSDASGPAFTSNTSQAFAVPSLREGVVLLRWTPAAHDANRQPSAGDGDWTGTLVPLAVETLRDPETRRILTTTFARINAVKADPAPEHLQTPSPTVPGYVGSRTCAACHTAAYVWWAATPHGRAYATLVARGRERDLDCIGCHVTGFARPFGATLEHLDELQGAGCESCHGPGSLHADNPRAADAGIKRATPEGICRECHDPDHDPSFQYLEKLPKLRAPAHASDAKSGRRAAALDASPGDPVSAQPKR